MTNRSRLSSHVLLIAVMTACLTATAASDEAKKRESADSWLDQAREHVNTIEDAKLLSDANHDLAYVLGRNDRLADAIGVAEKVLKAQKRVYAQTFVAKRHLAREQKDKYLAEMQRIERFALKANRESGNIYIDSHLVRAYVESGHVAEATRFAGEIPDQYHRGHAIQSIAGELAKLGKLDDAYRVIAQSPVVHRQNANARIAYAVARTGNVDDVLTAIKRLTRDKQRDNTYSNLVKALVAADRLAEAEQYAKKIVNPIQRATAIGLVSSKFSENETIEALNARIAAADSREEKLALYQRLVDVHVEAGKIDEAESAIEAMVQVIETFPREAATSKFGVSNDEAAKAQAKSLYLKTAAFLTKRGDADAGRQRIAWARKAILEMPEASGLLKMMLVPTLIGAQIEAGDLVGARKTLDDIELDFSRSQAASRVAVALIKAKNHEMAVDVADRITHSTGKGRAVGAVAAEWIRGGQLGSAKTLLNKLGTSSEDVEAYREVGKTMTELGRGGELQQWIAEMPTAAARVYACIGAAESFSKK